MKILEKKKSLTFFSTPNFGFKKWFVNIIYYLIVLGIYQLLKLIDIPLINFYIKEIIYDFANYIFYLIYLLFLYYCLFI